MDYLDSRSQMRPCDQRIPRQWNFSSTCSCQTFLAVASVYPMLQVLLLSPRDTTHSVYRPALPRHPPMHRHHLSLLLWFVRQSPDGPIGLRRINHEVPRRQTLSLVRGKDHILQFLNLPHRTPAVNCAVLGSPPASTGLDRSIRDKGTSHMDAVASLVRTAIRAGATDAPKVHPCWGGIAQAACTDESR